MAISGFGLGGAFEGFNQARQTGIQQQQVNQQGTYQQKLLELEQQKIKNQQQRELFTRADNDVSNIMKIVGDATEAGLIAGQDPKTIAEKLQPMVDLAANMKTKAGGDGSLVRAQFSALLAQPPKTKVLEAEAAAKVSPLEAAKPVSIPTDEYGGVTNMVYNKATRKFEPMQLPQTGGEAGTPMPQGQNLTGPNTRIADVQYDAPQYRDAQGRQVAVSGQQPQINLPEPLKSGNVEADSFLAKLPARLQATVKGVADYDINPTTFSTRIPKGQTQSMRQMVIDLTTRYSSLRGETYDQKEFVGRNAAVRTFQGSSPEARTLRSFNVLVSHLDLLSETAAALKNKDVTAFNYLKNQIAIATGHPEPNSFDAVKEIVGDELVKAVVGGAAALGDRESVKKVASNAKSEKQLMDVIDKYKKLAGGQLGGLKTQYEASSGRKDFDRFLNPSTKKMFAMPPTGGEEAAPQKPQEKKRPIWRDYFE